jgi:hypothetical protein
MIFPPLVFPASRVVRSAIQVVSPPMIVILMILEVSLMLLENIYGTGVTLDHRHIYHKLQDK